MERERMIVAWPDTGEWSDITRPEVTDDFLYLLYKENGNAEMYAFLRTKNLDIKLIHIKDDKIEKMLFPRDVIFKFAEIALGSL